MALILCVLAVAVRAALIAAPASAAARRLRASVPGVTPVALRIKRLELSQVGTYGSSRYAGFFQLPTWWAWCAVFQNWARVHAGLGKFPVSNPWYVPTILAWGREVGDLTTKPKVGEWVLYYGDISHIGYVVDASPNGDYTTVEGNYENAVQEVSHDPYDHLHYFLRIPGVA